MKKNNSIRLALFDMDGTLFESNLDWPHIRNRLNIQPGETILQSIYKDNRVDTRRLQTLENYERKNTLNISPIPGAPQFVAALREKGIIVVLITNNNLENTTYLLNKYNMSFHMVVTREQKMWKPSPDAFNHAMTRFNFKPRQTVSFGDSHYDIAASRAARLSHIYIITDPNADQPPYPDVTYFKDYHTLSL